MSKNIKQIKPQLDWLQHPDLYTPIYDLMSQLQMIKEGDGEINLALNEELKLRSRFKNAGHCRTSAHSFMLAFNTYSNIEDPHAAIAIAQMKQWDRAAKKLQADNRDLNDLGRGRIKIQNAGHYRDIKRLLNNRSSDGTIPELNMNHIRIIEGSVDDYLEKSRKSGYAGSINFDLAVNNRKGREGTFEVQAMPEDFQGAYDTSHYLYDIIRIIQDRREPKTSIDKKIEKALVLANSMIFIEQAQRSEHQYINLRADKDNLPYISKQEFQFTNEVLDHVATAVEALPGRRQKWQEKTTQATTEAKSCLVNAYFGQSSRRSLTKKKTSGYRSKKLA
jgi:hypothetical protein